MGPTASIAVENCAEPPLSGDVPRAFAPSLKVTVPVGVPPYCPVTVAAKVTFARTEKGSAMKLRMCLYSPY